MLGLVDGLEHRREDLVPVAEDLARGCPPWPGRRAPPRGCDGSGLRCRWCPRRSRGAGGRIAGCIGGVRLVDLGHGAHCCTVASGTRTVIASGWTRIFRRRRGWPVAAVELVGGLALELDVDPAAVRHAHERRLVGPADGHAGQDPRPLPRPRRGDDADLQPAVIRAGVVEGADAAGDGAEVADQDAARLALEPALAVHPDRHLLASGPRGPQAGPRVGDAAHPILHALVGLGDHPRVEARAGHDAEALAVDAPDVEAAIRCRAGPPRALPRGRSARRGCWRRGWPCRRGGWRAGAARARAARRAIAARCRRRPRRAGATRPRRWRGGPAWGPGGSSRPRTRAGRRTLRRPAARAARAGRRRATCWRGR